MASLDMQKPVFGNYFKFVLFIPLGEGEFLFKQCQILIFWPGGMLSQVQE